MYEKKNEFDLYKELVFSDLQRPCYLGLRKKRFFVCFPRIAGSYFAIYSHFGSKSKNGEMVKISQKSSRKATRMDFLVKNT